MVKNSLKYRDQDLTYKPYFDALQRFMSVCQAKHISAPFSKQGFESVLAIPGLINELTTPMADNFRQDNGGQLADAYLSCVKHAVEEHGNPFTQYQDIHGNRTSMEGYGATAVSGNYDMWSRLSPVITAGYLARARSIEMYQVMNHDSPTFTREYTAEYIMKGLNGDRLLATKAIRSGAVRGMFDLPLCEPHSVVESADNVNVEPVAMATGEILTTAPTLQTTPHINMIKTGSAGNLFEQSDFAKERFALERSVSIDYIRVSFAKGGTSAPTELFTQLIRLNFDRQMVTDTDIAERVWSKSVAIQYTDSDGVPKVKYLSLAAKINLDTGDYQVYSDGTTAITHVHFKARVTNTANEMATVMSDLKKYTLTLDVENKLYGSIPVIPEMTADFNAGGEGVSWVAYMTDLLTEKYGGIRDNDLEYVIDEAFTLRPSDSKLQLKLGGYKFSGTFPMIPTKVGGTDDLFATQRQGMKHYLTRIFPRSEKFTFFDEQIKRHWVIMGNDEDLDVLPDITWQNATSEVTGDEGVNAYRYGFSLDDQYGWIDSFKRRVRVIGSHDERWLNKPITAVLKTLSMAAPTTVYWAYMFRIFFRHQP